MRATNGEAAIAAASPSFRFGRFSSSMKSRPLENDSKPAFSRYTVLAPSWLICVRIESEKPPMSDVIATIDITPITTPRMVSAERSLLARSVSTEMPRMSQRRPIRRFTGVFLEVVCYS